MVGKLGKKIVSLSLALVLGGSLLAGCSKTEDTSSKSKSSKEDNGKIKIGISQIVEHKALDSAREGFIAALEEKGYKDKIDVEYKNAQGDQSLSENIAQSFVSQDKNLVLGIGTQSAQGLYNATQKAKKDIPVLITAVTDPVNAKLVKSLEKTETNVTGTSDALSIDTQFELLKKLVPNAKNIGILYNTSEANSEVQLKDAEKAAPKFGFKIVKGGVTGTNEVAQVLDSIIGKIDAIYVPTDNIVVSSMPLIYSKTIDKKIPIIGSEEGQVKDGALATDGINYSKLGYQTGLMAIEILEGKKPQDLPMQTTKETSTVINKETVGKLGIKLPEDIKNKAQMIGSGKGE
ncbi:ABC-type uncharacterized transport system, periplasmic component [Gottschalkia purinilytica]|uniref:ABC-type uncharacterized transport system, periplasmic component n=1 Tax=Gottschalkia purinilytica TaxID=1503 RepID=A0A0L0WDU7_GOTPU|nr:ABC transporter substrate-binding protein [Gottschalkia purinilytica]KNF09590.1 ABC-type uncharacterized transport system, periplasmic component [Gottschalkia purinilytica]